MSNLGKCNLTPNRYKEKSTFAAVVLISIVMAGLVILQHQSVFQAQALPVGLPPMTLTVVGPDGTQVVLNETDIGNLASYRAYGGYENALGFLKGLGNYTGVPIETFCEMVGGIRSGYNVRIIASDGYLTTMSFEMLNGNLVTFDNVTGQVVQHNQTLTPTLAYYYNDANVSSSDGPLRVAILGPEGLCTNSTLWAKKVVRLELHANLQAMNLTLVALNDTQLLLNESSVSNLPAARGVGGYRNQLGFVKGLGNYTGPSLNTFCNLVGGMNNKTVLRVTAVDNYTKTLSYEEVNGAFAAYDNVTGLPAQHNQSFTPILAYHFNDANLSSTDGPLRLAIVGPEGLATASSYWVKQVVKLEIRYSDDVAVTAVTPLETVIQQSYPCLVNVTVANKGGYDETFSVTAYANQTSIGTQTVTLSTGNSTTIVFTWNTTGFAYGNYTISASAAAVPNEISLSDNTLQDGQVTVTILGDVDFNFRVDMGDMTVILDSFGSFPAHPRYNPNCDLDVNGRIDMGDIITALLNFGQHF